MEEWIEYATSPDSDDMSTPPSEPAPYKNKRPRARVPRHIRYPAFEIEQILAWADAHYERTGKWPTADSGRVAEDSAEKWSVIDDALRAGNRGLPGRSSLARLLAEERGKRNIGDLPHLPIELILAWADAYHASSGKWPTHQSGRVSEDTEETWFIIDKALRSGLRGLPAGSSLSRLLAEQRGKRNVQDVGPLSIEEILAWADAYHARTGKWPSGHSGSVTEGSTTKWNNVNDALRGGQRGLPGGSSLVRLLAEQRGKPNRSTPPPLHVTEILGWVDAHFAATGKWPSRKSGPIGGAPGETWTAVNAALVTGSRGLGGKSSLAKLLAEHRNRELKSTQPLDLQRILAWADAHHTRTGKWPTAGSGPIVEAPGEKWSAINEALKSGRRGLKASGPLSQMLAENRGAPCYPRREPLTEAQILAWADAHYTRTGNWPTRTSGDVVDAPSETWERISSVLSTGDRSLSGGSSLAKLLAEHRGIRNQGALPRLDIEEILVWADRRHARLGRWPTPWCGVIEEAPGETWRAVETALNYQRRGLLGCGYRSLAHLLEDRRGAR